MENSATRLLHLELEKREVLISREAGAALMQARGGSPGCFSSRRNVGGGTRRVPGRKGKPPEESWKRGQSKVPGAYVFVLDVRSSFELNAVAA